MLVLDLQLTLFLLLAFIGGVVAVNWWLTRPKWASLKLSRNTAWQVCETLPFGVVVITPPDNRVAFINSTASRLLGQLEHNSSNGEMQKILQRFNEPAVEEIAARSGIIHQPVFLRWWRYTLTEGEALVVLAEGGDHQRFLRQQAFIGQLVHELRTPLTALVAHTEVIASSQTSAAVRTASIHTIQNGAQRMARLVRDMLELYRLETSEELVLQPTNPVLVAEDAIAQLILEAEDRGVTLDFEADTALPAVLAHPDRLKQVFLNLLDNAIKYCRPGDEIKVCLQDQPKGLLCRVQDSGPGISASDLPHVTERLYRARTTNEVEGNGIGLALVNEILRHHHTTLSIESVAEGPVTGTSCSWFLSHVPELSG